MASGVMGKAPERSLCLHPTVSTLLPTYLKIPLPLAQLVKNPPAMQETPVQFLGREDPLEGDRLPTPVFLGFPGGSAGKESTCSAGDLGLIPELRRSPGEGNSCPLQHSGLESSMGGIVHGVAKSQTRPSHFHFHSLQFPVLFASFFF